MDAKEFKRRALRGGYAYAPTVNDYMQTHDEPYTDDDIQEVYRLQTWRDEREHAMTEAVMQAQE